MTEPTILAALKTLSGIIIAPILMLFGWLGKRLYNRVDAIEQKVAELDKFQAVQATQLLDIKQDIHNMNIKLDKIIDKLSNK